MLIADEPITPPPSPIIKPKSNSSGSAIDNGRRDSCNTLRRSSVSFVRTLSSISAPLAQTDKLLVPSDGSKIFPPVLKFIRDMTRYAMVGGGKNCWRRTCSPLRRVWIGIVFKSGLITSPHNSTEFVAASNFCAYFRLIKRLRAIPAIS